VFTSAPRKPAPAWRNKFAHVSQAARVHRRERILKFIKKYNNRGNVAGISAIFCRCVSAQKKDTFYGNFETGTWIQMKWFGDTFQIPVMDRLNKCRPCFQKTISRTGCHFADFLLCSSLVPCCRYLLPADLLRSCPVCLARTRTQASRAGG
jgi:hypothetical protein